MRAPTIRRLINQDPSIHLDELLEDEGFGSDEEEETSGDHKKSRKKLSVREREYKVYYKLLNFILIRNSD